MSSARKLSSPSCWRQAVVGLLGPACILLALKQVCLAQSGITVEGPFTVFRTGTNEPLLTLSLPFSPPPGNSQPVLRFDFGFATAEPDVLDTFFDSFSVTLQRNDQSATALVLTADRTGVQWAPSNPGGLTLNPTDVQHADIPFPDLTPSLALKFVYSVTFALPALLAGSPLTLFLDLFDNLNQAASLAFVQNVRIETATQPTRLFSSPTVAGPYSEEAGAVLDEINRIFALAKPSANRFYRVQADQVTRITRIRVEGSELTVEYQLISLKLHSATSATGPYVEQSNVTLNETNRTFTISPPTGNRFYRVISDVPTRLKSPRRSGNQLELEYEFNP
jgi:hypothetical protein